MKTMNSVLEALEADHDQMKDWFEHMHRHPELSMREQRTASYIADIVRQWGYEVETGIGKYGIVASMTVGNSRKAIGLRADFDALPGDEARQVLQARAGHRMRVELHGEVVAHHDVLAERAGALDEALEPGVQLRRAAGDVELRDLRVPLQDLEALRDAFGRHRLGARGRGVDMAMPALLVAQLGDVHLQRGERERRQIDAGLAQLCFEVVVQSTSLSR